jgi:hypothetical protein
MVDCLRSGRQQVTFFLLPNLNHESNHQHILHREYIMDFFAKYMTIAYNFVVMFPRWLLFLVSGSIASVAINLLHRSSNKEAAKKQSEPKALSNPPPPPQLTAPISPSPVTRRGSAKQRKGKK